MYIYTHNICIYIYIYIYISVKSFIQIIRDTIKVTSHDSEGILQ